MKLLIIIALLTLSFIGCTAAEQTRWKEADKIGRSMNRLLDNQPIPAFEWSLQRHLLIELYSMEQRSVATFTYVRNPYTGKIASWCPSIGFPIPADTQLTNPWQSIGGVALSQAEPNGLYSSSATRGTYVICVGEDGKALPRYHEQDVETYMTLMEEKDGMLVPVSGTKPSFAITLPATP